MMRRLASMRCADGMGRQGHNDRDNQHASTISLTVRAMSGEVVWGPHPMKRTLPVGMLFRRVANALRKPVAAIKLLNGCREVFLGSSLEGAGILDEAVLSVVVLDLSLQASNGIREIISLSQAAGNTIFVCDEHERTMQDTLQEHMSLIAGACACITFSEVIKEWLEALLLSGKTVTWLDADMSDMCLSRSALLESQPGLLYLNTCSDDDDLKFYMVDLGGDFGDWIDQPILDEGRGAVWYGVMAKDNGYMLKGVNPPLDFWRSALCGGGFKFQENLVKCMKYIAPDIADFFGRWTVNGPPLEPVVKLSSAVVPSIPPMLTPGGIEECGKGAEVRGDFPHCMEPCDRVDSTSMACTAVQEYVAEAEGYLSVKVGERLILLSHDPQPGDDGCRWDSYVYAQLQTEHCGKGWIPLAVAWRRYFDENGKPWLHYDVTGKWCWEVSLCAHGMHI